MGAVASPVVSGLGLVNSVFGTALPIIGAANQVLGAVQNFGAGSAQDQLRAQQDLALRQLQAQQKLQSKQQAAETALERERIAANAAAADEDRRAALRRAVARQRARFGASGIANAGGGIRSSPSGAV